MLSFRQLEVFRAVMLTGSISAAAHQLGIAQPTVTNTVRRLEDVLGALLFDRSGARLRPTALARQVFKVVNPSLAGFDHLTDQIAHQRGHHVVEGDDPHYQRVLVHDHREVFTCGFKTFQRF